MLWRLNSALSISKTKKLKSWHGASFGSVTQLFIWNEKMQCHLRNISVFPILLGTIHLYVMSVCVKNDDMIPKNEMAMVNGGTVEICGQCWTELKMNEVNIMFWFCYDIDSWLLHIVSVCVGILEKLSAKLAGLNRAALKNVKSNSVETMWLQNGMRPAM